MNSAVSSPELSRSIEELVEAFGSRVEVVEQDSSGAVVRLVGVQLSARWSPQTGDLWFLIPYHYPDAAIYPYYVTGAQLPGGAIGGLQQVEWRGRPAIQVSLRHNGWNPAVDTALGSVLQTQEWLRAQ